MKKFLSLIFCFFICFLISSCSSKKEESFANAQDYDSVIAYEIEQLDGSNNFEEETIKSLSLYFRSNLTKTKNIPNKKHSNNYIYNIVKKSNSENLKIETDKTFIFENSNNWQKEISKADILKFLLSKNISVTTASNIKPKFENKKITGVIIGEKFISIKDIVDYFNLPSSYIYNIDNKKTSIIIYGHHKEDVVFIDTKNINDMAKNGKKSHEILNSINNNFYLITKNK